VQYFGGKVRRKETTRKIEAKMGSKWILVRLAGGVEWIQLAQDRDRDRLLWIRWWTLDF
jgi:hypothetical protein